MEITQLKEKIEEGRLRLEEALLTEPFESYYPKSLELDRLIEEYLDKIQD